MSGYTETSGLPLNRHSGAIYVTPTDFLAYSFIAVNAVNLYLSRLGVIPDVLLLGVAIPAFYWTLKEGFDPRRIRFFLLVVATLFCVYLLYATSRLSFVGFRNAAAIFTVTATFLFFYRASGYLMRSTGFLMVLVIAVASFIFLWKTPFSVAKNNINAAMCYYLIAIYLCRSHGRLIRTRHVTILFLLIGAVSAINGHRTLAGSSILLLLQYYILNMNVARVAMRNLMFAGLAGVVAGSIALMVNPRFAALTSAFNTYVTSEGGRRLNSGREILWPTVWEAIEANPVLGMGPGAVPGDLYETTLSAHSLYLQIGLQTGIVGFALLFLLFLSLWRAARPLGRPDTRAAENLMTVIITMVIVHSLFAVFLFQNALAVGVPVWMVLGLGLGTLAREAAEPGRRQGSTGPVAAGRDY